MRIPFLILTRDRPIQFKDMIESIKRNTYMKSIRLIICDNDSTQPEMVKYLKELSKDHEVIYNKSNDGFKGLDPGLELVDSNYMIISDPDIRLNRECPKLWVYDMIKLLEYIDTPKVGFALNLKFKPKCMLARFLANTERSYWERGFEVPFLDSPCYWAPVDTTLAVYRKDTFKHWETKKEFDKNLIYGPGIVYQNYNSKYKSEVIRVAGKYTVEHMGWYMEEKYWGDYKYYKGRCNNKMSSSIKNLTGFIDLYVSRVNEVDKVDEILSQLPDDFGPNHPLWNVPSKRNRYLMALGQMPLS